MELMLQNPTLIKRPVLENSKTVIVGFSANTYDKVRG
jgi:arsenate reductase-like glutaredoxin family protein